MRVLRIILMCFRGKISFELNQFGGRSRLMVGSKVKITYCPMTECCDVSNVGRKENSVVYHLKKFFSQALRVCLGPLGM